MTELPIDENTPRILIVEDEPKLGQLLIDYLRAASYAPTLISHGDQVLPYVRQTPPDLILLDLMLPGTDGLTLCREIRRFSDIPIVMVTAKIEEIDRLLGLEIGADDYICKPYSPREVVARVKTILRRCKPQRELQQQDAESPLIIDEGRFQASWRGKMLDLTPAELENLPNPNAEPEEKPKDNNGIDLTPVQPEEPAPVEQPQEKSGVPVWVIAVIAVGAVLLIGGIVLLVRKKKRG